MGKLKNESEAEADADEETSSRESSRRPKSRRSREEGERRDVKEKTFGKESPVARLKKREGRSTSCDSSGSKESLPAGARRSRKTKEAAKNYLNMLGQELAASSKQDEDAISIESFISAAQEKRLGEFEKDEKSAGVKESDSVEVVAPKTIKIESKEVLNSKEREASVGKKKPTDKKNALKKGLAEKKSEKNRLDYQRHTAKG